MSKFDITTSVFYRWRYWIGYGSILVLVIGLLFLTGIIMPEGIAKSEANSIIASSQLSLTELWHNTTPNTPFYLLQKASLAIFGATFIGIKLPAFILGLLTAIGMIFLLRRWFSPGIAMLTSIITIATGQFLFLTQQGSPGILYLFWPTIILLFATLVANRERFSIIWKVLLVISAALSLYTPLSIYVMVALLSAVLLHPHLRYIIRKIPKLQILSGVFFGVLLLVPLALTIIKNPGVGFALLGIPSEWPNLLANARDLVEQYFNFTSLGNRSILLPVFGLSSMLIILFGFYRIIRTRQTVQSYVILSWTVLLLPVLIINPIYISIMFVPLLLLLAFGLESLLRSWYGLFPRNPYARVTGLIPLIILVSSMVLFGLERFAYAYRYAPDITRNFSSDVLLIPNTSVLVVTHDEEELYKAIAQYHENLTVTTTIPDAGEYAATAAARDEQKVPTSIVTTGKTDDAARFYLYK